MIGDSEPSETVKDEAANWVAKLRAGDCTLRDERSFRAWLTADPTHATAFEAMHATWEIAAALPRDPARFGYQRPARRMGRREFVWTAGAVALAGGAFATWQGAAAEVYETKIGEQKHITLPDGSLMFLDTETRVSFRMQNAMRLMLLSSGRANLRVVSDHRPFRVQVRDQSITTNQSKFDVLDYGQVTSIVLIDGQARIEINRPGADQQLSLQSGERLRVSNSGVSRDRPNLSPLLAWQRGQVVFENSTLEQAASELNRYSDMKLVAADPVVASWRVSGVFPVGDNFAFVKAASKFLPLGMTQSSGHILMIQDKDRAKLG